jgi:hypothetical protein
MSELGQSLHGRSSGKPGHVGYGSESGSKFRAISGSARGRCGLMALPCTSFKLRNRSLESSAANSANMSGPPLSRCCRTSRVAFGGWMTAACSMASFGSSVQVRHGATCRRPMVPARLVTIASFGGCWTYLADLPDVSNVYFGTRRVPATVHGVVFNILAGSAEAPPRPSAASERLHHPIADDATARGTVALLVERSQYLHQFPVHILVPAQHMPGLQRIVTALGA